MSFRSILTLANGTKLPQIGLGTWLSKPNEVEFAVESAVRNGYRHLDLAIVYQNQDEVGAALKKVIPSVVTREELFITSKLWNTSHRPEEVEKELDETLSQLGIEYLDLYLIHFPVAFTPGRGLFPLHPLYKNQTEIDTKPTLVDTWRAMINLLKSKVRAVGVSNFRVEDIQAIIDATGVTLIANQIEAHPLLPQDDLVAYAREKKYISQLIVLWETTCLVNRSSQTIQLYKKLPISSVRLRHKYSSHGVCTEDTRLFQRAYTKTG